MTYSYNGRMISIEQIDGFGKRPGLWIGTPGELLKVASFGSEKKAELFEEWLRAFFEPMLAEEDDGK